MRRTGSDINVFACNEAPKKEHWQEGKLERMSCYLLSSTLNLAKS